MKIQVNGCGQVTYKGINYNGSAVVVVDEKTGKEAIKSGNAVSLEPINREKKKDVSEAERKVD